MQRRSDFSSPQVRKKKGGVGVRAREGRAHMRKRLFTMSGPFRGRTPGREFSLMTTQSFEV